LHFIWLLWNEMNMWLLTLAHLSAKEKVQKNE